MLQRQVYVAGHVKAMNNDIMENVDAIHNAIAQNLKISFQYFQWNVKKEPELRKNGARYVISPWGLSWDDENYYMVGYDSDADMIKHYRLDKMIQSASIQYEAGKTILPMPLHLAKLVFSGYVQSWVKLV